MIYGIIFLLFLLIAGCVTAYFFWKKYPIHLIIRSKLHLESIFDSIPDPIAIIDKEYKLSRVNRAYAVLTGKKFQEILRNPCYLFFPKRDAVCTNCLANKVFDTGEQQYLSEQSIIMKDGEHYFNFYFFPIKDKETKQIVSVVEYIKDVTVEVITKRQLQQAKDSLEKAYNHLQEEINMAKRIQKSILPTSCPDIEGLKLAASYSPVDSVGGDLYDFIPLNDFRMGIFLGDVSGHGLPAAFIGAMTKMSLYTHSHASLSAKEVMARINADMNRNISTEHYLTGFYGILDLNDNSLTYTRASHPFPMLIHKDGTSEALDTEGIFIGMVEDPQYEEKTIYLKPGDRLYLFTDGFYEDRNEKKQMLGYQNFGEILKETMKLPLELATNDILQKVVKFYSNARPEDDRSLVIMEITEKSRKERYRLLCDFDPDDDIIVTSLRRPEESENYVSTVLRKMDVKGYSDHCIRHMKVVLNELFSNAFEHGNKNDFSKQVIIAFSVDTTKVKVSCLDEGEGFKIDSVPDPTAIENVLKDRGRGVHIIKSFVDEIKQNEKGNRITIVKRKNSDKQ